MSSEDNATQIEDMNQFQTLERHAEDNRSKDARSDVIEAVPPLYMRGAIYMFVAVIVVCLILSYVVKVYVIVPAKGAILPEGQNVVVEAESQGIITKMFVAPGDQVKPGSVLMEMRQDEAGVDLTSLRAQHAIYETNRENLEAALAAVKELLSNPNLAYERPLDDFKDASAAMIYIAHLRTSIQSLDQARQSYESDLATQKEMMDTQIALQNATIKSLQANQASARKAVATLEQALERKRQDLERTIQLAEKRVVPETQVGEARDQVLSAETNLNQQRQQLTQYQLSENQARVEIGNQRTQFEKQKRDLKTQLDNAQLAYDKALADLATSISSFEQKLQSTNATLAEAVGKMRMRENTIDKLTVKSPVSGEIAALNYNTAGQSVGAGARVAVIVPDDVRPIVIVTVPNKDVGDIKEGISARVKVDAYPFREYGTVKATVTRVFPMADKDEFAVRLRLETNFITAKGKKIPLEPGLTVQVDLLTERKRILELLYKNMG